MDQNLFGDVITLKDINKTFYGSGGKYKLFDNFNFSIKDDPTRGQFVSIIGKSGCGKSQLLKLISGLSQPDSGQILVYGKPRSMNIPMVFQQYSSFPWLSVIDNVCLPLKLKGVSKKERYDRSEEVLKLVGLWEHKDKWCQYPTLSGGQLQRVSIARNLMTDSQIMLLDEATSALDLTTKREVQDILLDVYYSSHLDPTIINVTHDITEAVLLSDEVILLDSNPCRIFKKFDIEFGRKRSQDLRNNMTFNAYVSEIETAMIELNNK